MDEGQERGIELVVASKYPAKPFEFLRSCTNRLKSFYQGAKSSNNTKRLGRANRYLIIFGKPTRIVEPSQGTFNNPPLGQDLPFGFYACGNINTQAQLSGNILLKRLTVGNTAGPSIPACS